MQPHHQQEPEEKEFNLHSHVQPSETSHPPPKTGWERWKPLVMLMTAIFMPVFLETLDYTVVATSQTNIASIFNRLDLQSWIGTSYVLTSTVFLPIFASLSDILGRFWAMQISVWFFLIGSAVSTGANNMYALLAGRGIAGIGAAGLLSVVRIMLADSTSLDDNNIQGAVLVVLYTIGYSAGPVLGGVLLSANWRWVFAINLPVCAVSIILIWVLLRKITKGPQPPRRLSTLPKNAAEQLQHEIGAYRWARLDFIGAFLFIAFGILLLLALSWGSNQGWDQIKVIICFVVSGVCLLIFISWEWIVEHSTDYLLNGDVEDQKQGGIRASFARSLAPKWTRATDAMIPINLFRYYDIVATSFATMVSGMIMLGIFYFIAVFFVIVSGNDATHAGVQLLYFSPGMGIGVIIAIQLVKVLRQPRYAAWLGSAILPVALGLLSEALWKSDKKKINLYMALCGVGVGMGFGPLSYQARFTQPEERVAVVVGVNLFFRTLGGTVGIAQLAAVLNTRVRNYITNQITSGALPPSQALQILHSLTSLDSTGGIKSLPDELRAIINAAFTDGLRWAFISLIPWAGVAFILVLFLSHIPEERLGKRPEGGSSLLGGIFGGLMRARRARIDARRVRRAERRGHY